MQPRAALGELRARGGRDILHALPWIAPALLLIFGIVLYPAGRDVLQLHP